MRIVLINPPQPEKDLKSAFNKGAGFILPYNLLCLGSYLKRNGVETDILDSIAENIDMNKLDSSKDYQIIRRALRKAAYTIKDGEIVVKDGEILKTVFGKTLWVKPAVKQDLLEKVKTDISKKFEEYYTVKFSNYPVPESSLRESSKITIKGGN